MPQNRAATPITKHHGKQVDQATFNRAAQTQRTIGKHTASSYTLTTSAHRKVHKGVGADERRKPQDKMKQSPGRTGEGMRRWRRRRGDDGGAGGGGGVGGGGERKLSSQNV